MEITWSSSKLILVLHLTALTKLDSGSLIQSTVQMNIIKIVSGLCLLAIHRLSSKTLTPQCQTSERNPPKPIGVLTPSLFYSRISELVKSKTNFGMRLLLIITTFSIRLINFEQTLPSQSYL